MNYILGLTITGIITGIFGGLIGAGAEILIVPLLTIFKLYDSLKMSIGTSLIMLLPPIGIAASYNYYKNNYVDLYGGLYLSLLFVIFSWISSKLSINIDIKMLRKIFSIFTILCGIYIYF